MRGIRQEDIFGCGVACTAAALNISYQKAISLFQNGRESAVNTGFYCRDIAETLTRAGLDYKYKYIGKIQTHNLYKSGVIVFVRKSNKYPAGHYLYRWNNMWMDPWINFPNKNIKAGLRKRLPEKPIYVIYPV